MTNMEKMKNCLNQGGPFLRGVGAVTVQLYGTFKKLTQIIFPHSIIYTTLRITHNIFSLKMRLAFW